MRRFPVAHLDPPNVWSPVRPLLWHTCEVCAIQFSREGYQASYRLDIPNPLMSDPQGRVTRWRCEKCGPGEHPQDVWLDDPYGGALYWSFLMASVCGFLFVVWWMEWM